MVFRLALRAAALLLPLLAAPALAGPVLMTHFASEQAFRDHLAARGADVLSDLLVMARGRSGNNALGGAWEVGLMLPQEATALAPAASAQLYWPQSGDGHPWVPFSLSRLGEELVFTVGGATTRQEAPGFAAVTALGLEARATGQGETTILRSLALDGDRLPEGNVNAQGANPDHALLEGLSGDFTLTGEARLRWAHDLDMADPSRLFFQLSGYALAPAGLLVVEAPAAFTMEAMIPEPGSALMLLAGAAGLVCLRGRRGRGALAEGAEGDGSGGRI